MNASPLRNEGQLLIALLQRNGISYRADSELVELHAEVRTVSGIKNVLTAEAVAIILSSYTPLPITDSGSHTPNLDSPVRTATSQRLTILAKGDRQN